MAAGSWLAVGWWRWGWGLGDGNGMCTVLDCACTVSYSGSYLNKNGLIRHHGAL